MTVVSYRGNQRVEPDPEQLKARIVAAKAALDGARAAHRHSPNGQTEYVVARIERDLNAMLDQLPRPRAASE